MLYGLSFQGNLAVHGLSKAQPQLVYILQQNWRTLTLRSSERGDTKIRGFNHLFCKTFQSFMNPNLGLLFKNFSTTLLFLL